MKKNQVYSLLSVICGSLSITISAHAENTLLKRNVYTSTCNYSAPLTTFESCSEDTYIGIVSSACAMNQAMDDCRSEYNTECTQVAVKVWPEVSSEFLGYRICKAQVRVHGYEVVK